jgi:hypothetical protein
MGTLARLSFRDGYSPTGLGIFMMQQTPHAVLFLMS